VSGIFFHQGQTLRKPNPITAEKAHDQKPADIGILQDDFGTVCKYGRVGIGAAGDINRVGNRSGPRVSLKLKYFTQKVSSSLSK
jgi:hypothetical protein